MRLSISALTLLTAFILPAAAHADTFNFSIVGGGDTYTFSIDPANTPSTPLPGGILYTVTPDVTDVNSFGTFDLGSSVGVGTTPGGEGFGFSEIFFSSPDIFNGTTFVPGSYTVDLFGDPTAPYDLTISASTVPEPSSLAFLGTGALGLVGLVRRRIAR